MTVPISKRQPTLGILVVISQSRTGYYEMAKYVDGFVLVIPDDKGDEYKKMAEGGRDSWMKHGALAYYECRGDDLTPPGDGRREGPRIS